MKEESFLLSFEVLQRSRGVELTEVALKQYFALHHHFQQKELIQFHSENIFKVILHFLDIILC